MLFRSGISEIQVDLAAPDTNDLQSLADFFNGTTVDANGNLSQGAVLTGLHNAATEIGGSGVGVQLEVGHNGVDAPAFHIS